MRRALLAVGAAALLAPAAALADVQQVLLPGPTPYPTPSPPLVTNGAPPWANLTFRVHARAAQRIVTGVDAAGRPVSVRALQTLRLTGTGDYLIVVSAPVIDVRAGHGSDSQPGQRRGQILWSGFSPGRKVLAADATLRPRAVEPYLPLRVSARRQGDRYLLTLTNTTTTREIAFEGSGVRSELAQLLDRTRRESLAGERLTPAYVTIRGLLTQRPHKAEIAAPLAVEGSLRFPSRAVRFSLVLGDEQPLRRTVSVTAPGEPRLRLEARPAAVVRGLRPPGGRTWSAARAPAAELLRRLIDTRMELVRADQYRAFLANPDPNGANATTYVYETAASAPHIAAAATRPSGGGTSVLAVLLAVGGAIVALGAALVAWAHS